MIARDLCRRATVQRRRVEGTDGNINAELGMDQVETTLQTTIAGCALVGSCGTASPWDALAQTSDRPGGQELERISPGYTSRQSACQIIKAIPVH
jgi:hypothetical protein